MSALLAAIAWWATVGYGTRQAEQEVERGMGVLVQAAAISGPRGVALSIVVGTFCVEAGEGHLCLSIPVVGMEREYTVRRGLQALFALGAILFCVAC